MEMHPTAVKEEKGFSAIEVLLCIIIAVLIGFVGYYVYNTQKNTAKIQDSASAAAKSTPVKQPSKAPADTPAATSQKYLVIKEWNVKLPLSDTIKDAVYTVDTDQRILLSTASLSNTTCAVSSGAASGIYKYSSNKSSPYYDAQAVATASDLSVKIGDYYYLFSHAQAACSDDDSVQAQATANSAAFGAAAKLLEAE